MLKKLVFASLVIVSAFSFPVSANEATHPQDLTVEEKLYGLSLIWKEASYNFAFFDQVPDLDFDAAYQEYIPNVIATENTFEYYRELQKFIALLEDGHTNVYMPDGLASGYFDWPSVNLTEADHQAVVVGVEKSLEDQVPLGSVILSVDGISTETYLKTRIFPYIATSTDQIRWTWGVRDMLDGEPGSTVKVTLRTQDGEEKTASLIRNSNTRSNEMIFLSMPRPNGELLEFRWLDNGIAYLALNAFHDPAILDQFYEVYEDIKKSKGLIIDLRFNNGGDGGIASEIISHFADHPMQFSKYKTRKHIAVYKVWGQHADQYPQLEEYKVYADDNVWESEEPEILNPSDEAHIVPTAVLTSRVTVSAAEDFLILADTLEHFTTIGENTFGSTGQPAFYDLPGGGKVRICTKRDTYPDGRDFVGYGIKPDIYIQRTPELLLSGEDAVFGRAVEYLSDKI